MIMSGYLHPLYAQSLSEFGGAVELSASKGWILQRKISGTQLFDAMGLYPMFVCQNWAGLNSDLMGLKDKLVSLSLVTDPFGGYTEVSLASIFDIAKPYKEHFIVDLGQHPESFVSKHHQRNVRKALMQVDVDICSDNPVQYLSVWVSLYGNLIERHNIRGVAKFSEASFLDQLRTPGMIVFLVVYRTEIVGMSLWYLQGDVAYYHLAAYNPLGYQLNASFAMFWRAIEYFSDMNVNWLALGAGAGVKSKKDGLTRFKEGWSTGTRTAFFCGKIFDKKTYQNLTNQHNQQGTDYFPAYRAVEIKEV